MKTFIGHLLTKCLVLHWTLGKAVSTNRCGPCLSGAYSLVAQLTAGYCVSPCIRRMCQLARVLNCGFNNKTNVYYVLGKELPLSSFFHSSFYGGSHSLWGTQTLYRKMSFMLVPIIRPVLDKTLFLSGPQSLRPLSEGLGHCRCPTEPAGASLH